MSCNVKTATAIITSFGACVRRVKSQFCVLINMCIELLFFSVSMIILAVMDIINPTGREDLSGMGLTEQERERYVHLHQGISVVGLVFDILDLLCLTGLLVGVRMERAGLLLPAMLLLPVDILRLIASIIT